MKIHKAHDGAPLISFILLDWSVREHFQALKWLNEQDVERDLYELVWVEVFDRVAPEAMAACDVVITCEQKGIYHKHKAYNMGVLQAHGKIVTILDSDAIYPRNFVRSIIESFKVDAEEPVSQVLMHYQWRTRHEYPKDFSDLNQIGKYEWLPLWPNIGACVSFRKTDVIRFGGFDEHSSYRGYLCGAYDLGWRMVNLGIPERWHDEKVASWHFAHPAPSDWRGGFSWSKWREKRYPHIDHIALTSIENFATGKVLPLQENSEIFKLRMSSRKIGSESEAKYGDPVQMTHHFTVLGKLRLAAVLLFEGVNMEGRLRHHYRDHVLIPFVQIAQRKLGARYYNTVLKVFRIFAFRRSER